MELEYSKILLVALWLQYSGDWNKTRDAMLNKERADDFFIAESKRYFTKYGKENILTPLDKEWFDLGLDKLQYPPFVVNMVFCK